MSMGVLWQQSPLLWACIAYSYLSKVTPLLTALCHIGLQLRKLATLHYGCEPDIIMLPLTQHQIEAHLPCNLDLQMLLNFPGQLSNHYLSNNLLQGLQHLPIIRPTHFHSSTPILYAWVAFINASKGLYAMIIHQPHDYNHPKIQVTKHTFSNQVAEFLAVIQVLQHCPNWLVNIFFLIAIMLFRICHVIPYATLKQKDTSLDKALKTLQNTLQHHHHPWYIQHICSHSGLPGLLSQGNQHADHLVTIMSPKPHAST